MSLPVIAQNAQIADYARLSLAPETLRGYRSDWRDFTAWCRVKSLPALPAAPETVAAYLASLARTHGRSALRRRISTVTVPGSCDPNARESAICACSKFMRMSPG